MEPVHVRLILTVLAFLALGVPKVTLRTGPATASFAASSTHVTGPFAPDVLAVAGILVTLALFLVTRRNVT